MKLILNIILNILLILGCLLCAVMFSAIVYMTHYSELAKDKEIEEMYNLLVAQTGQIQDKPTLIIEENPEINAYTDGQKVVLYRGMITYTKGEVDELALVLGHELAHVMLRHTSYRQFTSSDTETSIAEANADKLGAIYVLKAGYDICEGRELWKRLRIETGNYQGSNHPDYSYRYDELNINCE